MLKYQNIRMFLQKVPLWIGLKFLWLKTLFLGHMLMEKQFLERLMKTNCKKKIKKNLELSKQSRKKEINGKVMIICLIVE